GVSGASTAPAVVVRDVPVVAFLVVDVPRGRLPLATADVAERVLDVVVQARRQAGVELVAGPVAGRAAGMAGLGAAGDVDGAAARRLQRLDSLDRGEVDLLERRAGRVVAVAAVAARRPRDARRAQALRRVAVAELGDLRAGLLRGRGRLSCLCGRGGHQDRKSTRLNSSHVKISYAVFCLKKKKR